MFKYGSFRNFVVKFFIGIVLFVFGLVYITSLYSYSPNDPGFNQLNYNINNNNIENLLGFFGANLSSYSLIFIGTLSYILAFYVVLLGGKLFLGIGSQLIVLKFLSNIIGIIMINISLKSTSITYLNTGLISQF
ncbi:DNA translocase FtsK 4TM domain-containing protein, partial [Pelagibacteraceae bacterium]|nr:DNA translocase FtsK 4TM domain-containing protein [Pelagibacteraceae bacterium]